MCFGNSTKEEIKVKRKDEKLMSQMEMELHDNWHKNSTNYPFLKDLHLLIKSGKISDFDLSFYKIGHVKRYMVVTVKLINKPVLWLFYTVTNQDKKHTVNSLLSLAYLG